MVRVFNKDSNNTIFVRALLDAGSQGSLITIDLARKLNLSLEPSRELVRGIGGLEMENSFGRSFVTVLPVCERYPVITTPVTCFRNLVGNQPACDLSESITDLTGGLDLADPEFYKSKSVDLLLGSDVFGKLVYGDKIDLNSSGLTAYRSVFGYVLLGPVECNSLNFSDTEFFGVSLSDTLQRFWEVEEPPTVVKSSPHDLECETFYKNHTIRLADGRFMTSLPFMSNRPLLGQSRGIAEKQFLAVERRLIRDSELRKKYVEFMREYSDLGHMSVSNFNVNSGEEHYYIPHHGVFKNTDKSKIRVVFNGSCPTSTGISLNHCLHSGPKLQRDITVILLNFRLHHTVLVTDIRMMFRQTLISPTDRKYQLILWRESPDEPLLTYELNTNTYGLKSSPYIAIRTLLELADRERERFPRAAAVLERDVYVDDILTGADSESSALELQQELIALMQSSGYELRKWLSNTQAVLANVPMEHKQVPLLFENEDNPQSVSVLGVLYDPVSDAFSYKSDIPSHGQVTKRNILSTVARMYDPNGWIAPILFWAKCLLQRLWLQGLDWDDPLNLDLEREWLSFRTDLDNVRKVSIPRRIMPTRATYVSLHGFSDASESGYAAVVYQRVQTQDGTVSVHLLMSKSKVAPIRSRLTIPKLELCGAVLLTKLLNHVCLCLQRTMDVQELNGWTDSSIALAWIRTPPHTLQVFEANRVSQIQNSSVPITWRHVPGQLNPADVASRGCSVSALVSHSLWWSPPWLTESESNWPELRVDQPTDLPGLRCFAVTNSDPELNLDFLLERFSNFDKLISVTGWIMRFVNNLRNKNTRTSQTYLTVSERKKALLHWVNLIQKQNFSSEIEQLRDDSQVKGHLRRLNPFIDKDGLLRVGGRLKNANLNFDARHPLLLPKAGTFVKLLITDLHIKNAHAGPNALLAILQRNFWVLSARRVVRNVTFKCISCYKLKGITSQPLMGNLPKDRVVAARPFEGVGTDFAGPFYIKTHKFRNPKITKAYLCVFVCLATKCVHLELVSELSTEAFVATLVRFVSRRGMPSIIRSDCGTNFKGADNYLRELHDFLERDQHSIGQEMSKRGITWIFDPPACPSWGGLFEAAVKSAKTHLRRCIGDTKLTFEELNTVFCKVEAVLNSRPLCPVSSDPNDLEVLTPGHFLIGQPLNAVSEYSLQDVKMCKLSRFQLLQQITQRFWHRWHLEYLHTLQQRVKWTDHVVPPKEGDLVLLKDENVPPLHWRRGRIVKLYPGSDGVVRLADVRVAQGVVLKRAIAKLSRLPID